MTSQNSNVQETPSMVNNHPPLIDQHLQRTIPNDASSSEPWSLDSVLSTLPTPVPSNPASPVPFFHLLERLKITKREGWKRFNIKNGESISDHMYRMSIIIMLAPASLQAKLDIHRCTKMALVHDMAEALVGDITPRDGVSKVEKNRRETETMDFLTSRLLGKSTGAMEQGQGLREIWQEYEDGKTKEAKFVKDVDKIELVLQMMEYERARDGQLDLGEFAWVAENIKLEEVKSWCREILKEREEFWDKKGRKNENGNDRKGLDIGKRLLAAAEK